MRNVWIICRKELGSYFVSPVAYLLLTMFGLLFGFFFWTELQYFVVAGMEMQMRGQMFPMNLNEQVIRPLLQNVSVIGLFFIPMITMRLFAEEKRTGTIELLATSPVRDLEIIVGKWLAAVTLYACLLLFTALNFALLFKYGNPDWKPLAVGYLGVKHVVPIHYGTFPILTGTPEQLRAELDGRGLKDVRIHAPEVGGSVA